MTTKLTRRMFRLNIKRRILRRVTVLRRHFSSFWNRILACLIGKKIKYKQLEQSSGLISNPSVVIRNSKFSSSVNMASVRCDHRDYKDSSDLVSLKISLLGDSDIGKTSFLTKYVGRECTEEDMETRGVNQMDKTLNVRGARISYSIWDLKGDDSCVGQIPVACEDSVAMLFMFDLTSRCTLNSVISWYQQARRFNQTAIPVIIGTKFDDFVQLPLDLQWTIASQARVYAKALNATLFFSSATYNINVNKIFKFITAKLFNLPWTLERNLTIGEPIIDF